MNFLAHLFLSGNNADVKIGNFIGDHVKGKDYERYPPNVQKGILLHRQIDWFTDRHPITKQGAERLKIAYGRYAGVVLDVFYDHFLAVNWNMFTAQPLHEFASSTYGLLARRYFALPRDVRSFVPFLIMNRRLESYARKDGLARALSIMADYTSMPNNVHLAMQVLEAHYTEFNREFLDFWKELSAEVDRYLKELNERDTF
ncbi:MAG: ACP phosphodiesterase [Breznakibacter sp.]